MKAYLKFGGPNLPAGTHTWFFDRELPTPEGGDYGYATTRAEPGDVVSVARIVDAEYYVNTGRAVECDADDGAVLPVETEGPLPVENEKDTL